MSTLNTNMNVQGDMNLNLKMADTTAITCDKCNNDTFLAGMMLRKVSALVSPSGQESMVPIQVMICVKCDHVNDVFKPSGLKDSDQPEK